MKLKIVLLSFCFVPAMALGQKGYFLSDSTSNYGVDVLEGDDITNSAFCRVKKGGSIIEYSPAEVKEYGFNDGRVYVSKEISSGGSSKRVFLERLQQGKATLYYYRSEGIRTFYIEKDSTIFMELPKNDGTKEKYSDRLLLLTNDCSNVSEAGKLVIYTRNSLSKLIEQYNICEQKPFPHFRYGITAGYEFSRLLPTGVEGSDLTNFNFRYDGGSSLGLFIDQPVLVSDFSVHAEITLSKHGYSYNKLTSSANMDYVANISSLKIPLMVRYTYPSEKIRPFVDLGLVGVYNVKNESLFFKDIIDGKTIEIIDTAHPALTDDYQTGYSLGSGIEYKLDYRKALLFELRYTRLYNQSPAEGRGSSNIILSTGISF